MFNSCGNRNCPQCAGAKRADWLDATTKLLLPNLDYYQVVFTMPAELSSLALGNRDDMFNLAHYMTGGPISDRRLVSHADGIVTFSARVGKTHGGSDETEEIKLTGAEFVRRWAMHILPEGYTKSRRVGGFSNHHRKRYMAECRELLDVVEAVSPVETASDEVTPEHLCPNCSIPLRLVSYVNRSGWRIVMNGPHRPE